ncbi:MAG: class I SAM-dependent methyltransferase [Dehalococcoidia bacterium]
MDGFDTRGYWERRLRGRYTLAGVGHHRLGERFNAWNYRVKGEVFDRVVQEFVPVVNGSRVIEIGPGTGFYVRRWLRAGAQVTGLDITEVAAQSLAAKHRDARFLTGDIGQPLAEPLASEAGQFDIACAMDVLYHIVDDDLFAAALANLSTLLRPGGRFIWSDQFVHQEVERTPHAVSRKLPDVERALATAGFKVLDRRPLAVLLGFPSDVRFGVARLAWKAVMAPAVLSDRVGGVMGALLYQPERLLVQRLREGPSTEIMVCERI